MPATPAAPVPPAAATPFEPKLLHTEIDHNYHFTLTCDLELDVTASKVKTTTIPLKGVALAGAWNCKVSKAEDDGRLMFEVQHGILPLGLFGQRVMVRMEIYAELDEYPHRLGQSSWTRGPSPTAAKSAQSAPPVSYSGYQITLKEEGVERVKWLSGKAYEPDKHRKYRLVFEIQQTPESPTSDARYLMRRVRGASRSRRGAGRLLTPAPPQISISRRRLTTCASSSRTFRSTARSSGWRASSSATRRTTSTRC